MLRNFLVVILFTTLLFGGVVFAQSVAWDASHDAQLKLELKSESAMFWKTMALPATGFFELGMKKQAWIASGVDIGLVGLTGTMWGLYASKPWIYLDDEGRNVGEDENWTKRETSAKLTTAIVFSSFIAVWHLLCAHYVAGETIEYNKKLMKQYKILHPSVALKKNGIWVGLAYNF